MQVRHLREHAAKIAEERDAKYNPNEQTSSVEQLGRIWAAMIEAKTGVPTEPLPPELVHHMFAAQKIHRACCNGNLDHYIDCGVYNDLALEEAIVRAGNEGTLEDFMRIDIH
jgi:hypothetical protein